MSTAKKKNKKEEAQGAAPESTGLVAKTEQPTALAAVSAPTLQQWGVRPVEAKHIIISRILTQQPMSKAVTAGKAVFGDLVESSNQVKLGNVESAPVEFIPFHMTENWVEFEEKAGAMKFARVVPVTPENDNAKLEEIVNGVKTRRDRTLEFFVLLPSDLANGIKRPYVMSFRRTSMRAGRKLYTTMFVTNPANGKVPAAQICKLSGTKTTNDKGTFVVLDVTESRDATAAEITAAFEWYKTIGAGGVKVDDTAFEQDQEVSTEAPSGPAQF